MSIYDNTIFVSLNTAAMLTGKSTRTIRSWLETGIAKGGESLNDSIEKNLVVDLRSINQHIPIELTPTLMDSIDKSEAGISEETTNIAIAFSKSHADKIAIQWFELAAKQGNNDAMFWLWKNYQTGCGVEPDFAVAIQWLGKAAKHGSITAQTTVESLKKINNIIMEQQKDEYNAIVEDIKRLAKSGDNDQK
jgi:Na+-translocating ferredoxin:NAD+ oxidoreductase RNF subunit RnfB